MEISSKEAGKTEGEVHEIPDSNPNSSDEVLDPSTPDVFDLDVVVSSDRSDVWKSCSESEDEESSEKKSGSAKEKEDSSTLKHEKDQSNDVDEDESQKECPEEVQISPEPTEAEGEHDQPEGTNKSPELETVETKIDNDSVEINEDIKPSETSLKVDGLPEETDGEGHEKPEETNNLANKSPESETAKTKIDDDSGEINEEIKPSETLSKVDVLPEETDEVVEARKSEEKDLEKEKDRIASPVKILQNIKIHDSPNKRYSEPEPVPGCSKDPDPFPSCYSTRSPRRTTTASAKSSPNKGNASDTASEVVISSDEYDEDDDLDPSLLCPEMSMDVDEQQVITSNDNASSHGTLSPLSFDELIRPDDFFNLTPSEEELRKKLYGSNNPIERTRLHCTACNVHLGSALANHINRFVHPLLKVLICKECYNFYTSGEFEKDEDGSELYCRWCGQGGQVLCCSKCECVFCKKCIRINFGLKKVIEIRDSDDWTCFKCDQTQITNQRIACKEFFDYFKRASKVHADYGDMLFFQNDLTFCCKSKVGVENRKVVRKRTKKQEIDEDYNPNKTLPSKPILNKPFRFTPSTSTAPPLAPITPTINLSSLVPKPRITTNPAPSSSSLLRALQPGRFLINPASSTTSPIFRTYGPNNARNAAPTGFVRLATPSNFMIPNQMASPGQRIVFKQAPNPLGGHDWFNRTVGATLNVKSQLAQQLSNLSRTKASGSTVSHMAFVHNKFQEILSTSINELIKIRKNLRVDFINNIKKDNKSAAPPVQTQNNVRFVGAPPSPIYFVPTVGTTMAGSSSMVTTSTPIVKPVLKRNVVSAIRQGFNANSGPGKYIKVKSMQDIQNAPPECITIPDDSDSFNKSDEEKGKAEDKQESVEVQEKEDEATSIECQVKEATKSAEVQEKEDASRKDGEDSLESREKQNSSHREESITTNKEKSVGLKTEENKENNANEPARNKKATRSTKRKFASIEGGFYYNIKDTPSPEIKRMCTVEVRLERSSKIDSNIKRTTNGHR